MFRLKRPDSASISEGTDSVSCFGLPIPFFSDSYGLFISRRNLELFPARREMFRDIWASIRSLIVREMQLERKTNHAARRPLFSCPAEDMKGC